MKLGQNADARFAAASAWLGAQRGLGGESIRGVLSPYRICPLGAHCDHQHGPVLGSAIDAYTALAFVPSQDSKLRISSAGFPGRLEIDLAAPQDGES